MNKYTVSATRIERTYSSIYFDILAENEDEALDKAENGHYEDVNYGDCNDSDFIEDDFSGADVELISEDVIVVNKDKKIKEAKIREI